MALKRQKVGKVGYMPERRVMINIKNKTSVQQIITSSNVYITDDYSNINYRWKNLKVNGFLWEKQLTL